MTTLREAAQAVLDRWDSPAWEWLKQGPTAALMADLRAALADQDRGWYTIDEINAKFDPELVPRRDDMNRWEAEIDSWRQRYEALLKTVANHEFLAPPMMLADKQSYELGLLHGAAARAALAEPVQEPVAWIHADPDKPRVKFLEWREDEPGYRGDWIKTPLYTAPKPPCATGDCIPSKCNICEVKE